MRELIDQCAEAGSPNLITFSGNRAGMDDRQGMDNCELFLNKIKAQAEDKNVNICMELLNSRVNHPDYMCDHVDWGVALCKRVNSPRVKLLFDIYHMQIMDGDIVRRITSNMQWMGHFHTGGVPGRHEIDNRSNELNYNFVAKAIADQGYKGFCAHEYSPAPGTRLFVFAEGSTRNLYGLAGDGNRTAVAGEEFRSALRSEVALRQPPVGLEQLDHNQSVQRI